MNLLLLIAALVAVVVVLLVPLVRERFSQEHRVWKAGDLARRAAEHADDSLTIIALPDGTTLLRRSFETEATEATHQNARPDTAFYEDSTFFQP